MSDRPPPPDCEETQAGRQSLIGGVRPISLRERLALRAASPLEPKRPQQRCDHGLFDEASRRQTDLVDLLRRFERGERG